MFLWEKCPPKCVDVHKSFLHTTRVAGSNPASPTRRPGGYDFLRGILPRPRQEITALINWKQMFRFRLFLLCLLMAAVPLQGFAAASMLFCGLDDGDASAHFSGAPSGHQEHQASTASDGHDHSMNSHLAQSGMNTTPDVGKQLPDSSHACGVCASCCTAVAIAEIPRALAFAPPPQSHSAEPFILIQSRPSPVPDKPPRA